MPRSARDIQLTELKDTISQLNELVRTQTAAMESLRKTIEQQQLDLENKTAEIAYLKGKLFGSSSEKTKLPFPGQISLFDTDDRVPEIIEPEEIEVSSHKRTRKPKATYEEQFDSLPVRRVPLDTLSDGGRSALHAERKWCRSEQKSSARSWSIIRQFLKK